MKKLHFAALLITTGLIFGCSKGPEAQSPEAPLASPGINRLTGTFTANMDGVPWQATELTLMPRIISLSGLDPQSKRGITIVIDPSNVVAGKTLVLEKDNVYEGVNTFKVDESGMRSDMVMSSTGEITIISASAQHIKGTFRMKAGKTYEVTDGAFSVVGATGL